MKYLKFAVMMFFASSLAFTACDDGGEKVVDVIFQSALQSGGTTDTTDSTALTLTFDVDPAALTGDDISVTGAAKGALSGTGTTRSLAISDITVADGETVSVTITSPEGYAVTGSPRTAVVYRISAANMTIGMDYRGGKLAYILQSGDTGYDADIPHGIIAASADQSAAVDWMPGSTALVPDGTETALGTGSSNTDNIITQAVAAENTDQTTYAAGVARSYDGGGYTDWYLPSKDEVDKLYLNKATIGGFTENAYYWSSSEFGQYHGHMMRMSDNYWTSGYKLDSFRVRAVRSF